jgi:hypothetical protein
MAGLAPVELACSDDGGVPAAKTLLEKGLFVIERAARPQPG